MANSKVVKPEGTEKPSGRGAGKSTGAVRGRATVSKMDKLPDEALGSGNKQDALREVPVESDNNGLRQKGRGGKEKLPAKRKGCVRVS